jgi:D-glycero-alpha-D-manno-heptose-7-phosphate kinase
MTHHGKAPFRLGLAGGGTDVSPYCDLHGGAVVNATISLYAHASIMPREDGKIVFIQQNSGKRWEGKAEEVLNIEDDFFLQQGIYNHIVKHYAHQPLSFELVTSMDVPTGSGLGTSSTLVVAIIAAFAEWLKLPLGNYDLARMAYEIERIELDKNGGRQDQYAATFGGFNFIEFRQDDTVIVNPLDLDKNFTNDLAYSLVLFYMKTSRASAHIIEKQQENIRKGKTEAIKATHQLKQSTWAMKEALLQSDLMKLGQIMDDSWQNKKKLSAHITNSKINAIYDAAIAAGAIGGKISGAGGGGFMMFCCPEHTKTKVVQALLNLGGQVFPYSFVNQGVEKWTSH